jgi:ACS family D-galactonate transporter-like MFS transporter
LLFVANTINYTDRVNISVAGPEIAQQFCLGPEALGIVFSCFSYSYTLLVLPMGLLTDRFGARFVMNTAMVIWALESLAHRQRRQGARNALPRPAATTHVGLAPQRDPDL